VSRKAHNLEIGCSTQQPPPTLGVIMIVKGLKNIRNHLHQTHLENRKDYYKRNPPRRRRYDGDYCDYDYPGPGLESMFWDMPNMR
jgi:hypothetical protein